MSDASRADARGDFSDVERRTIVHLAQACASFSLLGSTVILVANFRFKQLRTYSFKLVVWLAVCDIAINVSFFFGSPTDGSVLCYVQGVMQQFFQVALIQWTLLISQSLLTVTSAVRIFDGNKRMPWNHLWAWGVSAVLTVGPLWTEDIGAAECSFCWVKSGDWRNTGSVWRGIFLAVVFTSMVAIAWAYTSVVGRLDESQRSTRLLSRRTSQENVVPVTVFIKKRSPEQKKSPTTAEASSTSAENKAHPSSVKPEAQGRMLLGRPAVQPSHRSASHVWGTEVQSALKGHGKRHKLRTRRKNSVKRFTSDRRTHDADGGASIGIDNSQRSGMSDGQRSDSSSASSVLSRASSLLSFSRTSRTNSLVSTKNWLWSASREAGFVEEGKTLGIGDNYADDDDEEEEHKSVMWMNKSSAASRASPATLDRKLSPPLLPTLMEAEMGGVAVPSKQNDIDSSPVRSSVTRATANGAWASRSSISEKVAPGQSGDADSSRTSSKSSTSREGADLLSHAVVAVPPVSSRVAKDKNKISVTNDLNTFSNERGMGINTTTVATSQRRPSVSRLGKARGFVRRMSSIDVDHQGYATGPGSNNNVSSRDGPRAGGSSDATGRGLGVTRSGGPRMPPARRNAGGTASGPKDMDKFISRVKWYPVVYVLCWMFTLVNGIHTIAVGPQNSSFALVLLATSTCRLQGLVNFLLYGLNDKLKQAWLQDFMYRRFVGSLCRVLWCCCCSWPSKASGDKSDSRVAPTNAIHEAANQSNPVSIAPLSRSIIIAETMEEGEAGSAIILPPRPARLSSSPARTVASRRSMTLATPCVSRDDIMVAPMRPARPLRMAADGGYGKRRVRTAQDDAAGGVAVVTVRRQPRAGVVGGSSSGRRKHRKRVTKGPTSWRRSQRVELASSDTDDNFPSNADTRHRENHLRDKHLSVVPGLTPDLPITVSMALRGAPLPLPHARIPARPSTKPRLSSFSASSSNGSSSLSPKANFFDGSDRDSSSAESATGTIKTMRGARGHGGDEDASGLPNFVDRDRADTLAAATAATAQVFSVKSP